MYAYNTQENIAMLSVILVLTRMEVKIELRDISQTNTRQWPVNLNTLGVCNTYVVYTYWAPESSK